MSINSIAFLGFLGVCVLCYYLVPKRLRYLVLLAASIGFYLSHGYRAALYLGGTIAMTYGAALWLDALSARPVGGDDPETRKREKVRLMRKKRSILAVALALNFASLLVLKYSGFFVACVNRVSGWALPLPSFLLPLGISFYVFQTSGYLIDLYRGKYHAEKNFARYTLFACYFPQLIMGPINRFPELSEGLFAGNDFDWDNIQHGILRMMYGVLKKALVADLLAPIVAQLYTNYASYPGVLLFFGSLLYCLQLYCDFSGGVDIVCGASRLFGVRMAENFSRPYFSISLADFWRRWHMSLGEWMRDYLFYPVAFSKGFSRLSRTARRVLPPDIAKRVAPCAATFLVFLAVGVWQGPGWANIAYGLWNGFWMSLGMLWVPVGARLDRRIHYNRHPVLMTVWGVLRTNCLVIIGRYFSRSESLRGALGMLRRTVFSPGLSAVNAGLFLELGFTAKLLCCVLPMLCVVLCISIAQERGVDVAAWLCKQRWYFQFLVLFIALAILVFLVYANGSYTPIAYVYEKV